MAAVFFAEAALARYALLPRLVKGTYLVLAILLLAGLRLSRSARVHLNWQPFSIARYTLLL